MRTGPFSDPVVVTVMNRYFVPLHLDNTQGSARRYGMEPGHENAYIILETPEGGDESQKEKTETLILGRLSQVLDPDAALAEMRAFLARHKELHEEPAVPPEERGVFLLEEGEAELALPLLPKKSVLRARALRMLHRHTEALEELEALEPTPEVQMERIRLALPRLEAVPLLERFLALDSDHPEAAEAYYLRGALFHLEGKDEDALRIWKEGIERFPPPTSLFSQKAHLTLIRANWDLPANVDQPK